MHALRPFRFHPAPDIESVEQRSPLWQIVRGTFSRPEPFVFDRIGPAIGSFNDYAFRLHTTKKFISHGRGISPSLDVAREPLSFNTILLHFTPWTCFLFHNIFIDRVLPQIDTKLMRCFERMKKIYANLRWKMVYYGVIRDGRIIVP